MKKSPFLILIALIALLAACKKEKMDIPVNAAEVTTSGKHEKSMDASDDYFEERPADETVGYQDGFDIYLTAYVNFNVLETHGLPSRYFINFWYSRVDPQRGGGVIAHDLTATTNGRPYYYRGAQYLDYTNSLTRTHGTIGDRTPGNYEVLTVTKYVDVTVYSCEIYVSRIF
jgi:hypothetical protein